jgi:hypothetical protein
LVKWIPHAALLLLAASACGPGEPDDTAKLPPDQLEKAIQNLAVLKDEEEAKPPPRLGVLTEAEVPPEVSSGGSCRFFLQDRLLAVAGAGGAVVKIEGRPRLLVIQGPVGPSGGFFAAEKVTVSIGRRAPIGGAGPSTAAGITVGGDPARPVEKHDGSWVCAR